MRRIHTALQGSPSPAGPQPALAGPPQLRERSRHLRLADRRSRPGMGRDSAAMSKCLASAVRDNLLCCLLPNHGEPLSLVVAPSVMRWASSISRGRSRNREGVAKQPIANALAQPRARPDAARRSPAPTASYFLRHVLQRWSGRVLERSVIIHKRRGRGVRYFRGAVYLAAQRDRRKPCGE